MVGVSWLPVMIPIISLVASVLIFGLRDQNRMVRLIVGLTAALLKIVGVGVLMLGISEGVIQEIRFPVYMGFDLIFRADALSLLFVGLASVLWLVTTVYAHGYLAGSANQSRFFGFFGLCVSATTAIALAGNLLTFVVCYEILTLATYPLVAHKGTAEALSAARVYLMYTLLGGALVLGAMVCLSALSGAMDFSAHGFSSDLVVRHPWVLRIIFFILIAGFGVKAALFPLHGWLPRAMVAPAPVSALLHAVAVVKAGAFGIVRVVLDIYGLENCRNLGVLPWLVGAAAVTILYGSLKALSEDDFKRRLAFSTVSQVSYIILGVALASPMAIIGGLVHLVHQGVMKITMFFCAGNLAHRANITRVSQMFGVGRSMPWTMGAFTVAAFGMIGVPPLAGFISKWYLGIGALQSGHVGMLVVLLLSSVLNAGYFLPIIYRAWFEQNSQESVASVEGINSHGWSLVIPPLVTAFMAITMGVFAGGWFSPLHWVKQIVLQEYGF